MTSYPYQRIYVGRGSGRLRYSVDSVTQCWTWLLSTNGHYGMAWGGLAHREFYKELVGPIPDEHDVHHKCHNKLCVNPDHLVLMPSTVHEHLHPTVGKKCPPGCTCGRHKPKNYKPAGSKPCPPGCQCGRHSRSGYFR